MFLNWLDLQWQIEVVLTEGEMQYFITYSEQQQPF